MAGVSLVARLVLVAVFAVAGWAKLRDNDGVEQSVVEFGVPARLASPLATLLPRAELFVAALLLVPQLAPWGGAGAAVLLVLFTVGVAMALARGKRPECHCFGQVRVARVNLVTLGRNLVLLGLAAFVAARPG
jgi:uncharacterized membrane protein YphA (DoxX/SURF4 family)